MLSTALSMIRPDPSVDVEGYIHSIETAGTVDGPGIRYIVFTSGCPLACQYCHNPDTRIMKDGTQHMASGILNDIRSYAPFLKRAKGGVTLSGGEPLMQPDFTRTIFEGCHAMGLHTALDTSGFLGRKADDALLDATDLVLLDIKAGLPDLYHKVTSAQLDPTIAFAKRLSDINKSVWVRFVLVPGLTDSSENVTAVAKIASEIKSLERIDILPFHKMGEYKWAQMQQHYALKDTPPATQQDVDRVKDIFASMGLQSY